MAPAWGSLCFWRPSAPSLSEGEVDMRMNSSTRRWCAAALLSLSSAVWAQDCNDLGQRSQPVDPVAQGGRMYDNWWVTCGLPEPQGQHPAYPSVGKQSGATTWRCKECHGWDYRGKDGAYAKGSHFTGIAGISGSVGRDLSDIVVVLQDANHGFGKVMSEANLRLLARFVSQGQGTGASGINPLTKKVAGGTRVGKAIFQRNCIACHGSTGRALNFSDKLDEPEFIGTIARDNPWELLHKIRNGQPGGVMDERRINAPSGEAAGSGTGGMHGRGSMGRHMIQGQAMPSMRGILSVKQMNDLAAYLQTLPAR